MSAPSILALSPAPNGYSAIAVWDTAGVGESDAVPSGYVQYHDLTGAVSPITGGNVTIGTCPILLETKSAF